MKTSPRIVSRGLTAPSGQKSGSILRDDVRVITATIAFGMGINKPNVRFVVHYDLPKIWRAITRDRTRGRDGLPSECVLLFSATSKQIHFIDEKSDSEARIAGAEQQHAFAGQSVGPARSSPVIVSNFSQERNAHKTQRSVC